ncbi:MAG: NADH-quinone oxidoreductase subunit C [Anaerolineae bacterium]
MNERVVTDEVLAVLRSLCSEELEVCSAPVDETFVMMPAQRLGEAVSILREQFDIRHLSTITADYVNEELRLYYHFWEGLRLTLVISLPPEDPRITSLIEVIPGAAFYEREVYGMFGVKFEGHTGLRPLLLPDDWKDAAPMARGRGAGEAARNGEGTEGGGDE